MKPLICITFALLGSSALLSAATMFTEDFSSLSSGPNMTLSNPGSLTTTYTGGQFAITSAGNRAYLGTNETDYSLGDFVFEATVTVANTTSANAIVFFGMGSSTPSANSNPTFAEPLVGSNLFMAVRNDASRLEFRDNATSAVGGTGWGVAVTPVTGIPNSTHRLRMTWTASTGNALFEIDKAYAGGAFTADHFFNVAGANNGFTGSNSQLVLGGSQGLTFDNISVVPEPSAALLGGLGLLALLHRRR